jgi:hypothetical protein
MARSLTRREDGPGNTVGVRRPGATCSPTTGPDAAAAVMTRYRIVRDDGQSDTIAGQSFARYDAAYAVLERYYGDLCCSDEREYYSIEEESGAEALTDGQPD